MNKDTPFKTEAQNGIFNFFFVLVNEYSQHLPPEEAFDKAIGWFESFTTEMKVKHAEMIAERKTAHEKMQQGSS